MLGVVFMVSVSASPLCFNVGDVGILSFARCVGDAQLVSGFISEGIALF